MEYTVFLIDKDGRQRSVVTKDRTYPINVTFFDKKYKLAKCNIVGLGCEVESVVYEEIV